MEKEYIVREIEAGLIECEPIIRCKDCKWYQMSKNGFNGICNDLEIYSMPNDFCSMAERKEE